MVLRERVTYGHGLLAVSLALLCVPLFDMWDDVAVQGDTVLSTVLENSVFLGLCVLFVGLSAWLLRSDWDERYVRIVARWSALGTLSVAAVYAWVLGFQALVQGELKPYVIAADGVVIGGIVLFAAGVYNARSRMEGDALAVERDRVAALFENTSDAVAAVALDGGTATVTEANDAFATAFRTDAESVVGRPVTAVLADATAPVERERDGDAPIGADRDEAPVERVDDVVGDPDDRAEVRFDIGGTTRDFIVTYVPVGEPSAAARSASGFVMFTEITAQKERERQFERIGTGSDDLIETRSVDDALGVVREITADLFDGAFVGVWEHDRSTDSYRPRRQTAADGGDAEPALPTFDASGGEVDLIGGVDATDGVSEFDPDELATVLAERGHAVETTLVRRITDRHFLVVARADETVSQTESYLLDLLVANARTVVQRIDREDRLERRNDQLEFVNSLLRHDIQNSMTIINARGEVLADATEGKEADYADTIVEQSDDVSALIERFRTLLNVLTEDEVALESVAVGPIVDDRANVTSSMYPGATIRAEAPDGVSVLANETLENVLDNLIRNAVEHNDTDSPTVEISVTEAEHSVTIEVADDGPGVPEDERDVVFRRGNRGLKQAGIGSGFGLFFADTLVDAYGGSIAIRDNEPRGAVFAVTLPKPDGPSGDSAS
ncbi:HAMP domain-containing histidine kinase [Halorubrum sp. GN11_10-6_MGM]|uniref:sensor histidine kinase n=1 Tax=Halorubrum sp. GN11_10-6_MGM TaxID=2518112 RepID=UPI0010F7ACC9|nr:HAMP domain-containing sensor histidine kinase [Halorubrum sp. GN11_10-6_MGM]TKX75507.1 HAMP domain-containing histidine kinase [Halorubrum sp. GN11_10-6_MGM]